MSKYFFLFLLFYSTQLLSQQHLSYGKVLADRYFFCDTNSFKQLLSTTFSKTNFSTGLQTICESKNELEIRFYSRWAVIPLWRLFIITYNKGEWNAKEYWYNFGHKTHDTLHPVKVFALQPDYGFDSLFQSLKQNQIFTLPDESKLKYTLDYDDPSLDILTYKVGNKYRSYRILYPVNYKESYPKIKTFIYYNDLLTIFFNHLKREE